MVPILKPDKDKFNVSSYRPISLISNHSKILKKMISKHLTWHLEITEKITKYQCRFRWNHSTLDVLSSLHTDITDAITKKQHLILIALNIEKAYDMIWRKNVISTFIKYQISGNMLTFIHNFHHNCKIQVKIGNTLSNHLTTKNGLPQSSSISVTLFLIVINDIFNNLKNPMKYSLFADDCNI